MMTGPTATELFSDVRMFHGEMNVDIRGFLFHTTRDNTYRVLSVFALTCLAFKRASDGKTKTEKKLP